MIIKKSDIIRTIDLCRTIGMKKMHPALVIRSEKTTAEGAVIVHLDEKIIYNVIAGSNDPVDWVYDAKFHKDTIGFYEDKKIRVHCGFNESELSIHDAMEERLLDALKNHPDFTVIFGGHSLGGPSIELFYYRFPYEIASRALIFTFGSPCTGNELFCKLIEEKQRKLYRIPIVRFFHRDDFVVRLLENKFNYRHCGIPVELKSMNSNSPDNRIAGEFNHDLYDYRLSIQSELPEEYAIMF